MESEDKEEKLCGVFVAPAIPLDGEGRINKREFWRLLEYLAQAGVAGFCIGGATGEYPHFELEERKQLLVEAVSCVGSQARVLAAVGHSHQARTLELMEHAAAAGAEAVLLPPPHFYNYSQDDLLTFYRDTVRQAPLPVLLYNLPIFTAPLEGSTMCTLLQEEANLIGIKDSSGDPEWLRSLVRQIDTAKKALFIGSDALIFEGLRAGWDGCISGLGNICPEIILELYSAASRGDWEHAAMCQQEISKLSLRIQDFPVPWGIRAGLEVRGLNPGPPALPLSPTRRESLEHFKSWFAEWLGKTVPRCRSQIET